MIKIVIPAYNEQHHIAKLIKQIAEQLDDEHFQIIIVDDGSQDQTAKIVKDLSDHVPIQFIGHPQNRGLGAALRTGLSEVILHSHPDDIIITTEADGSQAPEKMQLLMNEISQGADIVIANPLLERGGFRGVPIYRQFLSRLGNGVYSTLFPISGLSDYTNLFRAYRAEVLQKGFAYYGPNLLFDHTGFEAVPDLIIKLRPFHPKFAQIPVTIDFTDKKTPSSMSLLRTISASLALCAHHLFSPPKPS